MGKWSVKIPEFLFLLAVENETALSTHNDPRCDCHAEGTIRKQIS